MKEVRTSQPRGLPNGYYPLEPVVPNRWQGECDCIVGPFSSRTVADYFANRVVDFGQYETVSRQVFVKGDSWYVEVKESAPPGVISHPRS